MKQWMKQIPKPKKSDFGFSKKEQIDLFLIFVEEIYHMVEIRSGKNFTFFLRERLSKKERKLLQEILTTWIEIALKQRKKFESNSINESLEILEEGIGSVHRVSEDFLSILYELNIIRKGEEGNQ